MFGCARQQTATTFTPYTTHTRTCSASASALAPTSVMRLLPTCSRSSVLFCCSACREEEHGAQEERVKGGCCHHSRPEAH